MVIKIVTAHVQKVFFFLNGDMYSKEWKVHKNISTLILARAVSTFLFGTQHHYSVMEVRTK